MPRFFAPGTVVGSSPRRAAKSAVRTSAKLAKAASAARSVVEPLEGRQLLSSYFVSPAGSDSNPGTLSAPFRTIQKAANVAQPGDTALIRAGTYREQVTVPRSGQSGRPITFKAYNGEKVVVSGADVVTGFSQHGGSVHKANQAWDLGFGKNQVFVDGRMMIEARWPNTTLDYSRPTKATADAGSNGQQTGTIVDAEASKPSGYFTGATLSILPGERWVAQTGKITGSTPGRLSYKLDGPLSSGSGEHVKANNTYHLTGKFQFLDAPTEWFRDSSGKLYVWMPDSGTPAGHTVEAKKRQYSFDLSGKNNITIEGLSTFANTIKTTYDAHHIVLSKLDAKYVSQYTQITNGYRTGKADTGIMLLGDDSVLKDSRIQYSSGNGVAVFGDRTVVTNNVIADVNFAAVDNASVFTYGKGIRVTWNTMYNSGRSLIKHDGSPGLKIMHNDLSNGALQTGDSGATYTWGSDGGGTEIAYNRVHGMHTAGTTGATGIYLDHHSKNFIVHHNLVYDVDRGMTTTTPQGANKIYNNTLVGTKWSLANYFKQSAAGSVIKNNIFTNQTSFSPGVTVSNNLMAGTNPQFVNPGANDYTLKSNSPAINKGLFIPAITDAGTPDLGAFEYGKAAWKAGANQGGTYVPPPSPTPNPGPQPGPQPGPTPTPSTGSTLVQGENFSWTNGARRTGGVLSHLDGGDYVKYAGVNFGSGKTKLTIRYAQAAAFTGGTIEVRLDNWNGKVVGSIRPTATGSSWGTFREMTVDLSKVTGQRNLYFAVKGADGVANIDWIKLA